MTNININKGYHHHNHNISKQYYLLSTLIIVIILVFIPNCYHINANHLAALTARYHQIKTLHEEFGYNMTVDSNNNNTTTNNNNNTTTEPTPTPTTTPPPTTTTTPILPTMSDCLQKNQILFQTWTDYLVGLPANCMTCGNIEYALRAERQLFQDDGFTGQCEIAQDCIKMSLDINLRGACPIAILGDAVAAPREFKSFYDNYWPQGTDYLHLFKHLCGITKPNCLSSEVICNMGRCEKMYIPPPPPT